jgi:acyl-CoA ligase (AMP-forming) (exosortase A-associated)
MKPWLIPHLLEASAERVPDKPFLVEAEQTLTFAETLDRSRRIAGALFKIGVRKGDHVGILLDKSIGQVLAMFGVWLAGGAVVIINPILTKEQIFHILRDCLIRTLVTSDAKVGGDPSGARTKVGTSELTAAGIRGVLRFGGKKPLGFEAETAIGTECEGIDPLEKEVPQITDDTSHIIYTSGSTGMPKGIVVSHGNSIDGAKIVSQYTGLVGDDRILGALPLNFDYGFNQLMDAALLGATLVLHTFFMPNDLLGVLERERISVFAGMPPIWLKLFNPKLSDPTKPRDFSNLRVITNSGGKVPVPVVRKLRSLFPQTRIFLMYGLTEAFRSTFLDPSEIDRRPESIGKAVPNVEVFVLNKAGRECGPDEEGELVHRGALITKGYWNAPEKTAEVFRPNPLLGEANRHLETVVFSGDIVKKDPEGFLTYVGRSDAMIKTKGYRVSPTEVEELLAGVEGVAECVACGYENNDEILLRAFVTLSQPNATPEEILLHCKKHFPFYLVPDDLVVLSKFPLTANGKIDRNQTIREHRGGDRPS